MRRTPLKHKNATQNRLLVGVGILVVLYIFWVLSQPSERVVERPPWLGQPGNLNQGEDLRNVHNNVKYSQHASALSRSNTATACTAEQALRQGELLQAAKVRGCPPSDDIWMRLVQLLHPKASVFVDIGSNKGYTGARFFALWAPELGVAPIQLSHAHKKLAIDPQLTDCGACSDCHEATKPLLNAQSLLCGVNRHISSDKNHAHSLKTAVDTACTGLSRKFKPIRVYGFDGNELLVNGVNKAISIMQPDQAARAEFNPLYQPDFEAAITSTNRAWTVELAAFSNDYKPGQTITFATNGELGHIVADPINKKKGEENTVKVPVLTVDYLMEREGLEHIDILKIDTEGHDLMVLEGAKKALRTASVTVIFFEYNKPWPAKRNGLPSLKSITNDLEVDGYICYLEGKNTVVRISKCWSDPLGSRMWSNVYCFQSAHPVGLTLISTFDSYALAFNN